MSEENKGEEKKPESNLLNDILKNALKTTKNVDAKAGLETKKCKNCQAARPDGTDLKYCDYCGYQFY